MIAILTPFLESQVVEPHCAATARALEESGRGRWFQCPNRGGVLANIRNDMLAAIESGYTHALFLDSDVGLPLEAIDTAIRSGYPIVGIGYKMDGQEYLCAADWVKGKRGLSMRPGKSVDGPEWERVGWVGAGSLLIDLNRLNSIDRPYFRYEWVTSSTGRFQTGEDMGFCMNCEDNGLPVMLYRAKGVVHRREPTTRGAFDMAPNEQDQPRYVKKVNPGQLAGEITAEMKGVERIADKCMELATALNATIDAHEAVIKERDEWKAKCEALESKPKRGGRKR